MIDVAFDRRETSHMSIGMRQYVAELAARLPRVAPELQFATFGSGDNFDWGEQAAMPLQIARMHPHLVHIPTPFTPLVIPAPYVMTIHDLIDLNFPQWTKPKARWYFGVAVRRAARGARCVITDDRATADDLVRFYELDPARIAVVPLGVDVPDVDPIRRTVPFVIYAGNRRPHKDLKTIVAAWHAVDPQMELDLVLTGPQLADLHIPRRERGSVVFAGELAHADVLRWMKGARALVHAALREGFGLPLLEAVRVGTPVICAQTSVPDVLRKHVRSFVPGDVRALTGAIESALRGELSEQTQRAQRETANLTWDHCASLTANVYRRFL
ncbi:MAG TPA: glycosyltransferase [Candidatus Baltobacteraceae bacterium]|jgi:glycosyltransferase involved in cell wall biosynthesis